MDARTDQDLGGGNLDIFGLKILQPSCDPLPKVSDFSNCVRPAKAKLVSQGEPFPNNDYQTVNRQKVSRLDREDSLYPQPSGEAGQILNVQYKCYQKNVAFLNSTNGVSVFCPPQAPSQPFVATNFSPLCRNVKPKTQEISKVIQDITADWNSTPQGQSKRAHHCHFDKKISESSIQAVLSEANLPYLGKGTFGSVFPSLKEPTLVVKKTERKINPNEILVPLRLKGCPNILQVHALDVRHGILSIVQQNCGASLNTLVKDEEFNNFFKDVTNRLAFIEGMFKGVEVLEKSKACHGDLKLENICARFENDVYVPRLIDFGTCQASSDMPSLDGISPEFLPPKVNSFALCVIQKTIDPQEQRMLLFDEKSDSWSVALVTICLWLEGLHPLPEVRSYVKFDLPERMIAMQKIAQLTEEAVDEFVPSDLDRVTKCVVRENLRVNADQRWGAQRTVEHLRRARPQQEGSMLPEVDVNLKRGKKRPVSPFHPSPSGCRNEDDVSELMDLFKIFQKRKPPDDVSVRKLEPPDAWQGKSVSPEFFEGKSPPRPTQDAGRSLISTLRFKPEQSSPGEVKVRRTQVLCPAGDPFHPPLSQPGAIVPSNIPDMTKLEEIQSCDPKGLKVKAASKKVVDLEDEVSDMVTNSSPMPDFDLLGVDCDMNNEPLGQNPTNPRAGGKTNRRRGSAKSKIVLK